ncbi:hypothetical protein [Aestuariivirga sp.]|uniref:hypothetical protein n=1 Tax=Aestuariivirga sp. TaxID=2650926 RepID=UPI0039E710D5
MSAYFILRNGGRILLNDASGGALIIAENVIPEPPVKAIPVRVRQRPFRSLVTEADPDFTTEDSNPIEYEFGKRIFRGRYRQRFPYSE